MTILAKHQSTYWTVCLMILFALTPRSGMPQTGMWIEIHVNGPWDFVPYKASALGYDQIALIIPKTKGHDDPVLLAGPHADQGSDLLKDFPITNVTLHTVAIVGLKKGDCPGNPKSTSTPYRNLPPISQPRIDAVIGGTATGSDGTPLPRFAIVLPKPCYTTSIAKGDGYSKIDLKEIDTTSSSLYTSWIVLHYFVSIVPFISLYDDLPLIFIGENGGAPAVSFVMRANKDLNDPECDTKSLMSLIASAALWDITGKIFAQFPQLNSDETQSTTYSPNHRCRSSSDGSKSAMQESVKGSLGLFSAGSGDCHRGQFVISNAL